MPELTLLEKLTGKRNENDIFYNKGRLKIIEKSLQKMKQINHLMLKKYELNDIWNKVNMGLMKHNIQTSLQQLVQFHICQSNKPQKSYFNPFQKKPITMCYNKFIDQKLFSQTLTYNIILYYDWRTKKINWNKLQQTTLSNVRALRLSNICNQNDKKCIKEQLKNRVFEKERFKGKTLNNLQDIIQQGLQDLTPVSRINVVSSQFNLQLL